MSIRQHIRSRIGADPVYECENCSLTYDRDRLNCPACGFTVRQVR